MNPRASHPKLHLPLPAVAILALWIGLHGHAGEEILHGVVAQVVADCPKAQEVPEQEQVLFMRNISHLPKCCKYYKLYPDF